MIDKLAAKRNPGKEVSYNSQSGNRPWLKNAQKIEVTGAVGELAESVQVKYFNNNGTFDYAWIGTSALSWKEVSAYASAIDSLKARKATLETELAEVTKAIAVLEKL